MHVQTYPYTCTHRTCGHQCIYATFTNYNCYLKGNIFCTTVSLRGKRSHSLRISLTHVKVLYMFTPIVWLTCVKGVALQINMGVKRLTSPAKINPLSTEDHFCGSAGSERDPVKMNVSLLNLYRLIAH